jgi:hypothetical protein
MLTNVQPIRYADELEPVPKRSLQSPAEHQKVRGQGQLFLSTVPSSKAGLPKGFLVA